MKQIEITNKTELYSFIDKYFEILNAEAMQNLLKAVTGVTAFFMYEPSKEQFKKHIEEYLTGDPREKPIFIISDELEQMRKTGKK